MHIYCRIKKKKDIDEYILRTVNEISRTVRYISIRRRFPPAFANYIQIGFLRTCEF